MKLNISVWLPGLSRKFNINIFCVKIDSNDNFGRFFYTIPFCFIMFRYFKASFFNFLNYFVWPMITDEGSLPEMRIWPILLIKSDS